MKTIFNKLFTYSFCLLSLFFSACSSSTETKVFNIQNIQISAEGPLFEGSNTAQLELNNPLQAYLTTEKIDIKNIKSAKLKSIQIDNADSSNFNMFQSLTLQLTSEKTPMLNLGVLNPIPADVKSINLNVANIQEDLVDILKQKSLFVVADALIKADTSANIKMNCNLEFELEIKK